MVEEKVGDEMMQIDPASTSLCIHAQSLQLCLTLCRLTTYGL